MKKVFGILFILIAILLALSLLFQLPTGISYFKAAINNSSNAAKVGELVGYLIATALMAAITIFLLMKGIKWLLQPTPPTKQLPNNN